jgi:hypothetical protein
MESKRRSNIVGLTLIGLTGGAVALANTVPPGQEVRRNLYPDRAACERDYSTPQCEPRSTGSSGSAYRGPSYYANRTLAEARGDPGPGRTGQITRSETSIRGGFGAFGRALHAVG